MQRSLRLVIQQHRLVYTRSRWQRRPLWTNGDMPTSAAKKYRTGVFFRGPSVTAFQRLSNIGKVPFLDLLTIDNTLIENVKSFPNLLEP